MAFKPGQSGNLNGRKPGSKNKTTEQWEAFASFMLNENLERFPEEMKKLRGKEYIAATTTLMEFFKPRLARTVDKNGNDVKYEFIIKKVE